VQATSLRRLHSVGKAIAHGGPFGHADILPLGNEATQIFGALAVQVLSKLPRQALQFPSRPRRPVR
jgi:hypothetical protein